MAGATDAEIGIGLVSKFVSIREGQAIERSNASGIVHNMRKIITGEIAIEMLSDNDLPESTRILMSQWLRDYLGRYNDQSVID
jgi:hypothetical protein